MINLCNFPDDILRIILKKYCGDFKYLAVVCRKFALIILENSVLYEKYYSVYFKNRIYEIFFAENTLNVFKKLNVKDLRYYQYEKVDNIIIAKILCKLDYHTPDTITEIKSIIANHYNSNYDNEFPFIKCAYLAAQRGNIDLLISLYQIAANIFNKRCNVRDHFVYNIKLNYNVYSNAMIVYTYLNVKNLSNFQQKFPSLTGKQGKWIRNISNYYSKYAKYNELWILLFDSKLTNLLSFLLSQNLDRDIIRFNEIIARSNVDDYDFCSSIYEKHFELCKSEERYYNINDVLNGRYSAYEFYQFYRNIVKLGYGNNSEQFKAMEYIVLRNGFYTNTQFNAPPINTPPINTPPINTPPINTPPVNAPPVNAPLIVQYLTVYDVYPDEDIALIIKFHTNGIVLGDISYKTIISTYDIFNNMLIYKVTPVHSDVECLIPFLIEEYEHLSLIIANFGVNRQIYHSGVNITIFREQLKILLGSIFESAIRFNHDHLELFSQKIDLCLLLLNSIMNNCCINFRLSILFDQQLCKFLFNQITLTKKRSTKIYICYKILSTYSYQIFNGYLISTANLIFNILNSTIVRGIGTCLYFPSNLIFNILNSTIVRGIGTCLYFPSNLTQQILDKYNIKPQWPIMSVVVISNVIIIQKIFAKLTYYIFNKCYKYMY